MGTDRLVGGSGLRLLRAVVGLAAAATCGRALWHGWIDALWTGTPGRLTYPLLGWVPVPAEPVLVGLVVACGLAGLLVALGVAERALLAGVATGMLWLGALEASAYLNHEVLLVVLAATLALLPAGRTVPWAAVLAPRLVLGSVYVWAAVAKLDAGWLAGAPLQGWLAPQRDLPVLGPLLTRPGTAQVLAVAALAFDALVVPALAWHRTRPYAIAAVLAFHGATAVLFPVGVFPWLMAGAAIGAFAPARLGWLPVLRLRRRGGEAPRGDRDAQPVPRWPVGSRVGVAGLVGLCALAPVRAVLPGSEPAWDGTGDHLAWRVMDHNRAGFVTWEVRDRASGERWEERPTDHLSPAQARLLSSTPSLLPPAARAIRDSWAREGRDVEVRAEVILSVDGGRAVSIVDPDVDLSRTGWTFGHPSWAVLGSRAGPA
jgi:vitamin K-dependent gamma-carboxylase